MDQKSFKKNIVPLKEKLFYVALRMLQEKEEAEDVTQEVFLKLWNIRDTLKKYDSIEAFAVTVTKNTCIDHLRKVNRETSIEDELYKRAGTDNPHLQLERKNSEEILTRIIESLPGLQQAIIKMKDIEEYEIEEIADITGTKPESVRMNLSRARKKVREEYLKYTHE